MEVTASLPVGLAMGSHLPPEIIPETAQLAESLGFKKIWLLEDYWFTGAISGATAALANTEHIPVGLGIVSAMVRHPSLLAMEISTIARMYPDRFFPGIGLGLPAWLQQMGLHPQSTLLAMRECLTAIRRLLVGDEVSFEGDNFKFERIKLTHPPTSNVPIYMGGLGKNMLRLSGELADGTVASVLSGEAYITWAREQISIGQKKSESNNSHSLTAFALFSCDHDENQALQTLRPTMAWYLSEVAKSPLTEIYGISDQLIKIIDTGTINLEIEMPDQWLKDLAVVGTPEQCASKIQRMLDAGADSVALFPVSPGDLAQTIRDAASEILLRC